VDTVSRWDGIAAAHGSLQGRCARAGFSAANRCLLLNPLIFVRFAPRQSLEPCRDLCAATLPPRQASFLRGHGGFVMNPVPLGRALIRVGGRVMCNRWL